MEMEARRGSWIPFGFLDTFGDAFISRVVRDIFFQGGTPCV